MSRSRSWSTIAAVSALTLLTVGFGAGCASDTGTAPADLHPPNQMEKAAALIRPAIAAIDMHVSGYVLDELGNVFNDGKPYEIDGTCTGFVVNPDGYIATAGHCVDIGPGSESFRDNYVQMAALEAHERRPQVSAEDFYAFGSKNWAVEGDSKGSPLDLKVAVQVGGGKTDPLPARVVDYRALGQGDVALLKVEAHALAAAELATDADVRIGDQVLAVGYPASTDLVTDRSAEPSNKEGAVSSKKTSGSVPVYEISAAVSPGMSGGPTVGSDGRVVGVNSFLIRGESQPFNFIAPAAGLTELLKRNGVQPALAPVDTTYRDGLSAFYAGRYTTAISDFDKVLALSPGHAKAGEMKTSAAQMRDKFGDWGSPSTDYKRWYVIGGSAAAAVLAAAGLVLLVLRRRRRGTVALAAPPATNPDLRFESAGPGGAAGTPGSQYGAGPGAPGNPDPQYGPPNYGAQTPNPAGARYGAATLNPGGAQSASPGHGAATLDPAGARSASVQGADSDSAGARFVPSPYGFTDPKPAVAESEWSAAGSAGPVSTVAQSESAGPDAAASSPAGAQTVPSEGGTAGQPLSSAGHAFCGSCGTRAEAGQKFCRTCGQAL
ncbi:serine protease [Nocardia blacklockiae]|uniref:serine protease n=1 Tax=Nocardia blacklockiae TaxID=480036 RepID=UPI001893B242|nr:serine protease [Nocardia blacklockiae]MBF6173793.1 trypsin-like peptidase domain-containing protein [Nocardia blacklockiae]